MGPLLSLHRYWLYSDRLRVLFRGALDDWPGDAEQPPGPAEAVLMLHTDPGIFMAYWHASLYVVIEGYRALGLHDPAIDILLQSPNVDHLRLFRNGTFHYQREPIPHKLVGIMSSQDAVTWLRQLHTRMGQFLLAQVKAQLPEDVRKQTQAMLEELGLMKLE
jgi:hypothetical protein